MELRRPHDLGKRSQTDFAFSDVFVPVHPGAKPRLGIIQMPRGKPLVTDEMIEISHHLPEPFRGGNIESGLKQMGGIEASEEALGEFRLLDDRRQMLKGMTQRTSLSGGYLQSDLAPRSSRR